MFENRKNKRRSLHCTGYLKLAHGEREFLVKNLSKSGFLAYLDDFEGLYKDIPLSIRLPSLKLHAYSCPVWAKPASGDGYEIGFRILRLDGINGLQFSYRPAGHSNPGIKTYMEVCNY